MTKKQTNQQQLKQLEQRIQELDSSWRRALADYQNLTKRVEKERWEAVLFATGSLLLKILKIADDLDLAVSHHPDLPWLKLVRDDLFKILQAEGITEIDPAGKSFDPQIMECVNQTNGPKNTVVKVIQKGYKLHDKILKPARVEVGQGQLQTQSSNVKAQSYNSKPISPLGF